MEGVDLSHLTEVERQRLLRRLLGAGKRDYCHVKDRARLVHPTYGKCTVVDASLKDRKLAVIKCGPPPMWRLVEKADLRLPIVQ